MATSFAPDRSRVPGPSTWLPGGSFWAFRKDPLAFFTNTARTYGDIAGFSFGPQKVYLVSRPEWVEDILVKSAGKFAKGVALERAKVLLGNGLLTVATEAQALARSGQDGHNKGAEAAAAALLQIRAARQLGAAS